MEWITQGQNRPRVLRMLFPQNQPTRVAMAAPMGPEGLPNQCPTPNLTEVSHRDCPGPTAGLSLARRTARKKNSSLNAFNTEPNRMRGANAGGLPRRLGSEPRVG